MAACSRTECVLAVNTPAPGGSIEGVCLEDVRGRYREQNSVFKAGDSFVSMLEHGITRNRPAGAFLKGSANLPDTVVYTFLAARPGQHGAIPGLATGVCRRTDSPAGPTYRDLAGPVTALTLCAVHVVGFLIGTEGTVQCRTYCPARGEILRPAHDEPRRRRSLAGTRLSIKNESLGIEDDQIPP